jgi:hypothetical protein
LPQGGVAGGALPAPLLEEADPLLDADPLLAPDPELDAPKPPLLGPVTTLQNVAVISSMQIVPVVGPCDPVVGACDPIVGACDDVPAPNAWFSPRGVPTCAAAGEAARSNAAVNASCFMSR